MTAEKGWWDDKTGLYDDCVEDVRTSKYLTFHLADQFFGIDFSYVTEIVGIGDILEEPDMPDFIRGVVNLGDLVIPVVNVHKLLDLDDREYNDCTCIIVMSIRETLVGLVADGIKEVIKITEDQVEDVPGELESSKEGLVHGMCKIDENEMIILNVVKIFCVE